MTQFEGANDGRFEKTVRHWIATAKHLKTGQP
jgi:hypothetical protein